MWHEARKQEKKIREVMVDFQRRAERRREHYDKMKADPTTYLRIIGTKYRLHLDLAGGDHDSTMIPWQSDPDNLISRYDARIHMDIIPDYSKLPDHELKWEEKQEEIKMSYERYRSVIMNEFNGVSEADALARIEVEEMFSGAKRIQKNPKKMSKNKSAIGYDYDQSLSSDKIKGDHEEQELSDESDYEIDFDVDEFSTGQIDQLNVVALNYQVSQGYFSRSLRSEKSFLMERKQAKMAEMEKSAYSGKKARKERRMFKELSLRTRLPSPPLFIPKENSLPDKNNDNDSKSSSSRSVSPDGKMEFITEFGNDTPPSTSTSGHVISTSGHVTSTSGHVTSTSGHVTSLPSPQSSQKKRRKSSESPPHRRRHRSREEYHRSRSRSRERDRQRSHIRDSTSKHRRSRSRSTDRVSALTKSKLEAKKLVTKKPYPSMTKKQEKTKLTPQERLKRKMQSQLTKTFREDKKVEKNKAEVKEVERIEREEKMKEDTQRLKRRLEDSPPPYRHHYSRSPSPVGYRY